MMHDIDSSSSALDRIVADLNGLIDQHFSETDTRVKFIDPILTQVLGWEEVPHIKREEQYREEENKRCIDYTISLGEPVLIVEAKKHLLPFEIPDIDKTRFKLDGVLQKWTNAWAAIQQCREYCDHKGAKYGVVTNGRQYIAFKAISERPGGWLKGSAVVWRTPEELQSRFPEFYQCLSRETILQDRLSVIAGEESTHATRQRPRTVLGTLGTGSFRNELYNVLHKVFADVLLDTLDPTPEFLAKCYCTSESIVKYGQQLDSILVDDLPAFRAPIQPVRPGHKKDPFDKHVTGLLDVTKFRPLNIPLVVVMGGGGVGKTTFLQWYFRTHLA